MRIAFIINGSKKKSAVIPSLLRSSQRSADEYSYFTTTGRRDAINIAFECAPLFDLIVAVGGDGTLHECLNGIMQFREKSPGIPCAALAIMPLGTGNDFVRNFRQNIDLQFPGDTDLPAMTRKMDVGCMTGYDHSRYFINIADAGFGPVAVHYAEKLPRGLPGSLTFGLGILRAFFGYRKKHIRVRSENFNWQGPALMVVIANGRCFGGGVVIAPEADLSDGLLELVIIGNVSLMDYIRYLPQLRRGQLIRHPEVHYARVSSVELAGEGHTEMDGELGLELPVSVKVLPGAIDFLILS